MPDRSTAGIREAARAVGPLQVLTHFGGEFERRADGSIRGFERNDGVVGEETNRYYRDFVRSMNEIGYDGYIGYELCHQLPVVDGQTVGIEYADENARLAAEFMRELIDAEAASTVGAVSTGPCSVRNHLREASHRAVGADRIRN